MPFQNFDMEVGFINFIGNYLKYLAAMEDSSAVITFPSVALKEVRYIQIPPRPPNGAMLANGFLQLYKRSQSLFWKKWKNTWIGAYVR